MATRSSGIAPFARTDIGWGPTRATLLVSAGTEHGDYGDPLLGADPAPWPTPSSTTSPR